jgi:hypothetical protein
VKLPSEQTLRDYTHIFKTTTGFQEEVDNMLREEVTGMSHGVTLVDEMKVKECLVLL